MFGGSFYFSTSQVPPEKSYEEAVRAAESGRGDRTIFINGACPCPSHDITLLCCQARALPDRYLLKLPIRGYVNAKSASRRQQSKWIPVLAMQWEKIQGEISVHE